MTKSLGKRRVVTIAMALGLALHASVAFAVPILSIDPPTTIVGPGETFSLDVAIRDVTDLYAFQFDLGFDPAILAATSVNEGPFLPSGGLTSFIPGTINNTAGSITFTLDTLLGPVPGVTGSGILASATFDALSFGTSHLSLTNVLFFDSGFSVISFTTQDGLVSVVPEPATLILLGSGLARAAVMRKRLTR